MRMTTRKNINPRPVRQRRVVRPRYEVVEASMEIPFVPTIVSVLSMHDTEAEAWRAWRKLPDEEGAPNIYVWDAELRGIVDRRPRTKAE
jgi:hypothetical protein